MRASARAEADALQARIKPHFLFNSMNTIAGLVRRDPAVAERAVLDLSDLFRAALGAGEGESSLAEEVELAERYLSIEALRLGERLQVRWRRAEPLPWTLPLPRLVLQPLVENAVLHGISRLPAGRHDRHRTRRRCATCCTSACATRRRRRASATCRQAAARGHAPAQHRPSPGLCLRPARAHDRTLARGLLSLAELRVPVAGPR